MLHCLGGTLGSAPPHHHGCSWECWAPPITPRLQSQHPLPQSARTATLKTESSSCWSASEKGGPPKSDLGSSKSSGVCSPASLPGEPLLCGAGQADAETHHGHPAKIQCWPRAPRATHLPPSHYQLLLDAGPLKRRAEEGRHQARGSLWFQSQGKGCTPSTSQQSVSVLKES